MTDIELREIENKIGYRFNDKLLLLQAFTHSSYANVANVSDNERLEFLGDAVLELAVSEYLYENCRAHSAGELSTMRSNIVSADGLKPFVEEMDILQYLRVSSGAQVIKSVSKKLAANLFEAVLGAIYIDGGIDCARKYVSELIVKRLSDYPSSVRKDCKTLLQEYCQKNKLSTPVYKMTDKSGSDNQPTYVFDLYVDGKPVSTGRGTSKKAAEQNAAEKIVVKWRI
ncbi:MAG: ribonuclease III [Corallococcus sp.]|nr:ribonuclease III [Bacillota bacterium]MCM1534172.1 ribonuclease III [Corallococcus sp.]